MRGSLPAFPRCDAATDEVAHVTGELGIGIRDRLALADEAAKLFHQRLRLALPACGSGSWRLAQ